jgi:hypothetical protein
VQNIADHVLHPALFPEILQGLRQVVLVPDVLHDSNVVSNDTPIARPVCREGIIQGAPTQQAVHEASNGTTSMFALSAVDQDGLAEQNRNQCHLDGMLHALPPRASLMPPTVVQEQPLPYAPSIPRIVPDRYKTSHGLWRGTGILTHGTVDRDIDPDLYSLCGY